MDKTVLRIVTTGSVDDGKSTLIGRLLYETNCIPEDQYESVKKYSLKRGKEDVDLSFLLDGLEAERAQGITIDVAYRYFETDKRKFIVADCPGHEQYTRNMVTGASNADLALILIDARNGVLTQSKRHGFIVSLLGIPHLIVAINKMDLVGYSEERYREIINEYESFCGSLNIPSVVFVPVSALKGDNVVKSSGNMEWYEGQTILQIIENINASTGNNIDFRFAVQSVLRPNDAFRGYSGRIISGSAKQGEKVVVFPSLKESEIESIYEGDKKIETSSSPKSVVLTLRDNIDVNRGSMIARKNNKPIVTNRFDAMICWMDDKNPLIKNKRYILKHTTQNVNAFVRTIYYKTDVNTLHRDKTNELVLNDIGKVMIETSKNIFADLYQVNRGTGSFILIDADTNNTVAGGMIKALNSDAPNKIHNETIWFVGLPCSGKTTLANALSKELEYEGYKVVTLDGDEIRKGLNEDLGFGKNNRKENIRRASHVCKMLNDKGLIVIASFVTPTEELRSLAKGIVKNIKIIYLDCPAKQCMIRDVKGMYREAMEGKIANFTGVQEAFDTPLSPYMTLNTEKDSIEECIKQIMNKLKGEI